MRPHAVRQVRLQCLALFLQRERWDQMLQQRGVGFGQEAAQKEVSELKVLVGLKRVLLSGSWSSQTRETGETGPAFVFAFGEKPQNGVSCDVRVQHQTKSGEERLQGHVEKLEGVGASAGVVMRDGPQEAHLKVFLV